MHAAGPLSSFSSIQCLSSPLYCQSLLCLSVLCCMAQMVKEVVSASAGTFCSLFGPHNAVIYLLANFGFPLILLEGCCHQLLLHSCSKYINIASITVGAIFLQSASNPLDLNMWYHLTTIVSMWKQFAHLEQMWILVWIPIQSHTVHMWKGGTSTTASISISIQTPLIS